MNSLLFFLFDFWCMRRLTFFLTSQQFQYCDSSTLANFKAWAQMISSFFTTAGWTQSTDAGQVNWSTIASVPASNAYVYEIWQPNDGLTTFYLKVEYGNVGTTSQPSIRLTLSSTTNGAGTATGFIVGPYNTQTNGVTNNATTQFECDMSGAAGRIGFMLWRNGTSGNQQQLFAVERSVNSSGAYTSSYVSLWTCGSCSSNNNFASGSLVFGVGSIGYPNNTAGATGGWFSRVAQHSNGAGNSAAFNGSIPFDTAAPCIGYFDYACTMVGCGAFSDFADGVTFTVTLYGNTRTYMPGKSGPFNIGVYNDGSSHSSVCMRYD